MSKRIALKDLIEVDGVDISNYVRAVTFTSTDDRIDASGFNPTGSQEFLSGQRVDEVALDIMMGREANQPHQVLWPLHRDRSDFDFVWRSDSSVAVGPTNPELRGTVALPEYSEGATRGELEVQTLTFVGSDATDPLVFYET
jgi:hypothetical protein